MFICGVMYIVHDYALFRMHTRCHVQCRVTMRMNGVAGLLLSVMPLMSSNTFFNDMNSVRDCAFLGCMLIVTRDVESL